MKGPEDITTKTLDSTSWLEVVSVVPVPEKILEWGLGPGESSVLAFAHKHPRMEAIIDDLAGRKCADHLNIPVR